MQVLRVGPLGTLWARLGDCRAVVSQNRYFVRFLRVQTITGPGQKVYIARPRAYNRGLYTLLQVLSG